MAWYWVDCRWKREQVQNGNMQPMTDDISTRDIADILRRRWSGVLFSCLAGLLGAIVYIVITPSQYEASWDLQMAQLLGNTGKNMGFSNSEEPGSLIERLRLQTTYPNQVLQSCRIGKEAGVGQYLNGMLKVILVKNAPSTVTMKLRANSPDIARSCALAIVGMIAQQQKGIIEERMTATRERLAAYQQALEEEEQSFAKLRINNSASNLAYLLRLEKLNLLLERTDQLEQDILMSQKYPAKLLAPIYVSNEPVSPRVGLIIAAGLLIGLISGALFAAIRESLHGR